MAAERVARHDEDHQTLELSERNAEWLCAVGLPSALDRVRARRRAA